MRPPVVKAPKRKLVHAACKVCKTDPHYVRIGTGACTACAAIAKRAAREPRRLPPRHRAEGWCPANEHLNPLIVTETGECWQCLRDARLRDRGRYYRALRKTRATAQEKKVGPSS